MKIRPLSFIYFGLLLLVFFSAIFGKGVSSFYHTQNIVNLSIPGKNYFNAPSLFSYKTATSVLLQLMGYLALTFLSGAYLLKKTLGDIASKMQGMSFVRIYLHELMLFALSFLPGYLIFIAINRLTTLSIPQEISWPLLVAFYWILAAFFLLHFFKERKVMQRKFFSLLLFALLLIFFLILQVQWPGGHVTGDAVGVLISEIQSNQLLNPGKAFPILTKHYDEILYFYPFLKYFTQAEKDYLLPWWFLGAFAKVFTIAPLYFFCNYFATRLSTFFFCFIFLFWGNHFLHPLQTQLLFDSGNPLGDSLHIGRLLNAILPILSFVAVFALPFKKTPLFSLATLLILLMGMGFSSLTISMCALIPLSFAYALLKKNFAPPRFAPTLYGVLTYLLLLFPFMIYFSAKTFVWGYWILFAIMAILSFANITWIKKISFNRLGLLFTFSCFMGLALLGNLAAKGLNLLPHVAFHEQTPVKKMNWMHPSFHCQSWPTQHCASPSAFFKNYALVLILASLTFFLLYKKKRNPLGHHGTLFLSSALMLFLLGLFVYDYSSGEHVDALQVWFKSRLPEMGYSSIILISLLSLNKLSLPLYRFTLAILTLNFFIYEFFYSQSIGRWGILLKNFHYLGQNLFH